MLSSGELELILRFLMVRHTLAVGDTSSGTRQGLICRNCGQCGGIVICDDTALIAAKVRRRHADSDNLKVDFAQCFSVRWIEPFLEAEDDFSRRNVLLQADSDYVGRPICNCGKFDTSNCLCGTTLCDCEVTNHVRENSLWRHVTIKFVRIVDWRDSENQCICFEIKDWVFRCQLESDSKGSLCRWDQARGHSGKVAIGLDERTKRERPEGVDVVDGVCPVI